jgi:pimeloyl-ACP methyl ester carboxylesterase
VIGPGNFFRGILGRFWAEPKRYFIALREQSDRKAAIVFIHGFSGNADQTWGELPRLLLSQPRLSSWGMYSLGYATSLRVDVPNLWAADPPLGRLVLSLQTALSTSPLRDYGSIALIAHSMGGLVAQGAVVEGGGNVGFLALFGTPSGGLGKAAVLGLVKRQFRDMAPGSDFIRALRSKWRKSFPRVTPFRFMVVAGQRDEFVPEESSLAPFPRDVQRVVPGNHLEIVKPRGVNDESVRLIVDFLTTGLGAPTFVDSAFVAAERRDFQEVIGILGPREAALDQNAIVTLALAYDAVGRQQDAVKLLELRAVSSDAWGTLGGRYKRIWLTTREAKYWTMAKERYLKGLAAAEADPVPDAGQAMYHAINVAFLDLLAQPAESAPSAVVQDMAKKAIACAGMIAPQMWKWATVGEARLMLTDLPGARDAYLLALAAGPTPRQVDSMYGQAVRVAAHVFGQEGVKAIEAVFGMT